MTPPEQSRSLQSSAVRVAERPRPNWPPLRDYWTFLQRVVRNPGLVGAVAPSSPELAAAMAAVVPSTGSPVVVELGPGTGALSRAISQRLPESGRHIAIELDSGMVEHLRAELPWLEVIQGDAAELTALLDKAGVSRADVVISGLPWAVFSAELQRKILTEVGLALSATGAFTTFTYLHATGMKSARRFRQQLESNFDEVLVTRTVWRNVPPALFYVCRRPLTAGTQA